MHLAMVISALGTEPRANESARPLVPSLWSGRSVLVSSSHSASKAGLVPENVRVASRRNKVTNTRILRRPSDLIRLVQGQPVAASAGLGVVSSARSRALAGICLDTTSSQLGAAEALGKVFCSGVCVTLAEAKSRAHFVGHFRIGCGGISNRSAGHVTVHQSAAAGGRTAHICLCERNIRCIQVHTCSSLGTASHSQIPAVPRGHASQWSWPAQSPKQRAAPGAAAR